MEQNQCPLCKGDMTDGTTEVTFRRDKSIIVIEDVPALVCANCGEALIASEISQKIYDIAEGELKRGVVLEFVRFAA